MSVKETVLNILEKNKGLTVSGQLIAQEANASRAAVWKAIGQLREEGYLISASTKKGYTLSENSDLLSAEAIHPFCLEIPKDKIYCYKTTDSTNNKAKQLAVQGESTSPAQGESTSPAQGGANPPLQRNTNSAIQRNTNSAIQKNMNPSLIVSEEQTGGRGRMGRHFFSPHATGIYMSLLIKPDFDISKSILVTTAASVAVCRAIDSLLGVNCQIKWVNDIFLNERKIGGILTEAITDFESGQIDYIVIGIGINYWHPTTSFPEEIKETAGSLFNQQPPTPKSIEAASSSPAPTVTPPPTYLKSRNELIGKITSELLNLLNPLDPTSFLEEYKSRSAILGHQIVFSYPRDGEIVSATGKALDIDANGGLVISLDDGTIKTLSSGEVSIRKRPQI